MGQSKGSVRFDELIATKRCIGKCNFACGKKSESEQHVHR